MKPGMGLCRFVYVWIPTVEMYLFVVHVIGQGKDFGCGKSLVRVRTQPNSNSITSVEDEGLHSSSSSSSSSSSTSIHLLFQTVTYISAISCLRELSRCGLTSSAIPRRAGMKYLLCTSTPLSLAWKL